jgi:hypothetical protein
MGDSSRWRVVAGSLAVAVGGVAVAWYAREGIGKALRQLGTSSADPDARRMEECISVAEENTATTLHAVSSLKPALEELRAVSGEAATKRAGELTTLCGEAAERCHFVLGQLSSIAGPSVSSVVRLRRKRCVMALLAALDRGGGGGSDLLGPPEDMSPPNGWQVLASYIDGRPASWLPLVPLPAVVEGGGIEALREELFE